MMQTLRKYMKHIMWVVAICFIATIVFSWGMGGFKDKQSPGQRGIIGEINGQKIEYKNFAAAVENELRALRERNPNVEINDYRRKSIRDQVWQQMVQEVLFSEEIQRLNLRATSEEIVFTLRNNPPEFLRGSEQFLTDGQFDISKYQQALNDPQNFDAWIPVENYLRAMIPIQKLQQHVLTTVRVTDDEAFHAYKLENEKVDARYLFFDPASETVDSTEIDDADMMDYYNSHRDDFKDPEQRKIQYILIEGTPSAQDSADVWIDADDIIAQLKDGVDFAELAAESDDAGSASKGGDLGYFARGTMVAEFEDAVFSARRGEIVGPVQTVHGLHIIEVLGTKREDGELKKHARHILLKFQTSSETYDALFERAQYVYDEVMKSKDDQFEAIAIQEGLTVQETPFFREGTFIPGIGMASRPNYMAFQQKLKWVSEPLFMNNNILVFRVSEIQKEGVKSFIDSKATIWPVIEREKKLVKASERSRQIVEIARNQGFDAAAHEATLEIQETGSFNQNGYVTHVGRDPAFSGMAFRLDIDVISPVVEGARGYYILQVATHTHVDAAEFESVKEAEKERLIQRKQQNTYVAWYNDLKEKADIEDYRNIFF